MATTFRMPLATWRALFWALVPRHKELSSAKIVRQKTTIFIWLVFTCHTFDQSISILSFWALISHSSLFVSGFRRLLVPQRFYLLVKIPRFPRNYPWFFPKTETSHQRGPSPCPKNRFFLQGLSQSWPPLHRAAHRNDLDAIQRLVEVGIFTARGRLSEKIKTMDSLV